MVIAAGGMGSRLGGRVPKQFVLLDGKPILLRTLEIFAGVHAVKRIVVVAPVAHLARVKKIVLRSGIRKRVDVVPGGQERQDSVWNGLQALKPAPGVVLIHDAVRPFVSRKLISEAIRETFIHNAVVPAVRTGDTIKVEGRKGFLTRTLDRSVLWAAQTPQGFQYDLLVRAHELAREKKVIATDDAALMELLGIPVRIIEGEGRNIKITTRDELHLAELFVKGY